MREVRVSEERRWWRKWNRICWPAGEEVREGERRKRGDEIDPDISDGERVQVT